LKSGNLSAAQTDFATLQQDLQQQGSTSTHHFHHHHGGGTEQTGGQNGQNNPATLFGELGQQLQAGNVTAAQQTYAALQQDFQQFTSGSPFSYSNATNSGSLSVSA
jgi:hypothetical protein